MTDNALPLQGASETLLPAEPSEAVADLNTALAEPGDDRMKLGSRLRTIVSAHPAFLDGWAHLSAWAMDIGDPVAAYAFARTGYHRGLDRLRKAGWRGQGSVPWRHQPNEGFLRSVHALMRAAAAIGEIDEAERCRAFLLDLDPDDHLRARDFDLGDLRG